MNYIPGSATDVLCRGAPRQWRCTRGMRIDLLQPDGSYWRVETSIVIAKGYKRSNPIENRRHGGAQRPLHGRGRPRRTSSACRSS
jgi:hypothetical protein